MDDTKNFLKDIGLDYYAKKLEEAFKPKPKVVEPMPRNIMTFFSKTSMRMDDPRMACEVHIKNLVLTYGESAVIEALTLVTELYK